MDLNFQICERRPEIAGGIIEILTSSHIAVPSKLV